MTDSASVALSEVNIHDAGLLECPWSFFSRLRNEAPVLKHEESGIYQVSSYDLVTQATADPGTFSSLISHALHGRAAVSERVKAAMAEGYPRPATLQTADAPIHTRSRKIVNKAFTLRRVDAMADEITKLADLLVDKFAARGSCEFVSEFAQPLPMMMILRQLGVPESEMEMARAFNDAFAAQFAKVAGEDAEVAAARKIVEFQKYFAAMIEDKRRNPTDDIISDIANASLSEEGDDSLLSIPEALQIIQQVLVAGNETTASSTSAMMHHLIGEPQLMERARDDAGLRARIVEETLRLHSPVQSMWRVCMRDTVLGGTKIPKDALVLLRFGSANHDEAIFSESGQFDPDRSALKRQVAFGSGIHFCLGAALARREMTISLERLLTRIGGWRFAEGNDFTHHSSIILRGMKELNLEFDPV